MRHNDLVFLLFYLKMIYFVGLGVGNPEHITAYGCEILRTCKCINIFSFANFGVLKL